MNSKATIIFQLLAALVQIGNGFTSIVPDKWKPVVAGVVALAQIAQARLAHNYNPDGTPASVGYVKPAVLLAFLLVPGLLMAQTAATPTQHFSMSGQVVSYIGPGGSAPASVADGAFNVTKSFSLGYQQITIPQLATVKLGTVSYNTTLDKLSGKKLTAKFVFDASKIGVEFLVGVGKLNQDALNVNRIAETARVCIDYPFGANVSFQPICGQYLHGGIVNGFLTTGLPTSPNNNTGAVSTGLKVHF